MAHLGHRALPLALALVASTAAGKRPVDSAPPSASEVLHQISILIGPFGWVCVGALAVASCALVWIYLSRMHENERAAEAAFEAAALRSIIATPPAVQTTPADQETPPIEGTAPVGGATLQAETAPPAEVSPLAELVPVPAAPSERGQASDVMGAIERLKRAGLVVAEEGFADANGDPHGAVIIQMRNGTHALVTPWPQTEEYMSRALRRFDLLVMAAAGGRAYSVGPLEKLIADEVVSSMFPPPSG